MNESTMPRIYTDPAQSEKTVIIVGDMDLLEEKLTNMPDVETDEQAELVSEYRAQFRGKANALDKERLAMTEGSRATTKMVNDKYNVIIERAQRCTQLADNKLIPYMRKREKERQEAERKRREAEEEERQAAAVAKTAREEADRVAAESTSAEELAGAQKDLDDARDGLDSLKRTPVARPVKAAVQGTLGSQTAMRKNWKYKLTDITKVPEDYLVPPEERLAKGALNTVAKRDQENAFVPGIEFYYEDALTSRAGVKS